MLKKSDKVQSDRHDAGKKASKRAKTQNAKASRLVVRNLPFKCTEEDVKSHFEQYGTVTEVNFVRRNDVFTGCGFVQLDNKWNAAKALAKTSGKEFKGRVIIVDWAVAKDRFQAPKPVEVKKEEEEDEVQMEVNDDEPEEEEEEEEEEESDEDDEKPDEDVLDSAQIKREADLDAIKQKHKEEDELNVRTVFLKNVPFTATNDELKEAARKLGPISYALICVDPMTEHSRGTAFVRFENASTVDNLLAGNTSLIVKNEPVQVFRARPKKELETKRKVPSDNRNLYLVREGVIAAGSVASQGVSESDMAKRLKLEQWKSSVLRNLHMFVSPVRLIIHNLPEHVDNAQLRELFKKHSPKGAVILESRVMKTINDQVLGKSKGYGFVAFQRHDDALAALRSLNNNPTVFSDKKRPIVGFSIENQMKLKIREKKQLAAKKTAMKSTDESEPRQQVTPKTRHKSTETPKFAGITAKYGVKKMRSKHQLVAQSQIHRKQVKKEKKQLKVSRKQKREKAMKARRNQ